MTEASLLSIILNALLLPLLHCVTLRVFSKVRSRQGITLLVCLGSGLIGFISSTLLLPRESLSMGTFACALLLPLLFSHIYFHIFNMSETSRRIRMILEITLKSNLESTAINYSDSEIIGLRIQRLLDLKIINLVEKKLTLVNIHSLWMTRPMKWIEFVLFPERKR